MPLDDAQRPSRKPPEPKKRKDLEPESFEAPPPETYEGDPRAWCRLAPVLRKANATLWRAMCSADVKVAAEAACKVQERAWGKARMAEPEPAGTPVQVGGDLGQAQDTLEKLLSTMVEDLRQRIAKGFNGPALVREAREAAEVLQQLLARRQDAAKAAGLEGASAADLVATLAEQMSPADLSMLRERLAQVAGAKEAMQ